MRRLDLDVLRRSAERGLKLAQDTSPQFIDIFQHILDEIEREVKLDGHTCSYASTGMYEPFDEACAICGKFKPI